PVRQFSKLVVSATHPTFRMLFRPFRLKEFANIGSFCGNTKLSYCFLDFSLGTQCWNQICEGGL
ncbi:MAG: hypothetical protein RRY33_06005, partial [Alistipes sp.]